MTKLISHQLKNMRKICFSIIIIIIVVVLLLSSLIISKNYRRNSFENCMGTRFGVTDSIGPFEYDVTSNTKTLEIIGDLKKTNINQGYVAYIVISPKGEKYKFKVSKNEKKVSKKIRLPAAGKWIVELENNGCAGEIDVTFKHFIK